MQSEPLIESVRRMAKRPDLYVAEIDVVALLAALERAERIEKAAREHVAAHEADWKRHASKEYDKAEAEKYWPAVGMFEEKVADLDAALKEIQ